VKHSFYTNYFYIFGIMDHNELLIPLRKIMRSVHLDSKKLLKECGLTTPQLLALKFLQTATNYQTTQLELRKHLALNSSTVTGIVSRLIKKGLIAKLPAREDKRATQLCLTANGLKAIKEAPPQTQDKLAKGIEQLTENEKVQIKSSLLKLTEILSNNLD
jgi:DNA-binding MarR family transcriptional regulator